MLDYELLRNRSVISYQFFAYYTWEALVSFVRRAVSGKLLKSSFFSNPGTSGISMLLN